MISRQIPALHAACQPIVPAAYCSAYNPPVMDKQPPTEFEVKQAQRAFKRITALLPRLPPEKLEQLEFLADAFLVGTDDETEQIQRLIETAPLNIEAVIQLAREILARHGVDQAS